MKITHCIQELTRLLSLDGNLDAESVVINKDNLHIKINDTWYEFEEYQISE